MRVLSLVAVALSACSYGVMPAQEASAPPSKPPLGEAAPPPELAPPPPPRNAEAGCPGIDPQGQCRGDTAIWCEGGQLRSVDCASIGRACELVDEATGYYCGRPVGAAPPEEIEENPGDPPNEGAPPVPAPDPDEPAPPPEDGEGAPAPPNEGPDAPEEEDAPPPPAPNPPEEAPEPPDNGAPAPPDEAPEGPCGGVTYLGHCDGHIAVWCDGQQVHRDDCSQSGLTCGYVDEETGFYCREGDAGAPAPPAPEPNEPAPPPPDEGAPPPEADGCGDIDYFGACEGAVVVYCSNQTLVRHDCAPSGTTCGWINDEIGNWCVEL